MYKRIFLIMLISAITLGLCACGGESNASAENDSTGLEWPSEYMSTLPAPDAKISSIDKLNGTEEIKEGDTTTQPSSVNVVMNEMTKKEALSYYDELKSAGFTINTDEKSSDKILLVGTLNDEGKNPFLFGYTAEDNFGNVSINILGEVYSEDSGDVGDDSPLEWPTQLMGDILPVPSGVITSIDRGDTFFGSDAPAYITVVSFKAMSRKDCEMYANKLKKLGFTDDVTEQDTKTKIIYSGSMNSEGIGVTFQYAFEDDKGFVSYNPMLIDSIEEWPSKEMGGLPDPDCFLVQFNTEGTDENLVSSVEFADMTEQEAKDYVTTLKELGFTPETDLSDDDKILFKGFDDDGHGVVFDYSVYYENGIISYGKKDAFLGC